MRNCKCTLTKIDFVGAGSSGSSSSFASDGMQGTTSGFPSTSTGDSSEESEDDLRGMGEDDGKDPNLDPYWVPLDEAGRTPLFADITLSVLVATLIILNLYRVHKVSNLFISKLLLVLSRSILPSPNSIPSSEAKASSMLKRLGLGYNTIHACNNGCVLYRGPHEHHDLCRICHAPQWKRSGHTLVPISVLRHFPLVSRLRRMFATHSLAKLMIWHRENRSRDGRMRSPVDSPQWRHLENEYPDFETDPQNIHLGLGADGINRYAQKRSTYSVWPIILFNYNLPPWLTIKKYFIMLSLLIPGLNSVTSYHIDVFRPLCGKN